MDDAKKLRVIYGHANTLVHLEGTPFNRISCRTRFEAVVAGARLVREQAAAAEIVKASMEERLAAEVRPWAAGRAS